MIAVSAAPVALADGVAGEVAAIGPGELPLAADWLAANHPDLFPSKRTAERAASDQIVKPPNGNKAPNCQVAVYRTTGQKRHSKALIRPDVADPRAELARLLGKEIVEFRPAEPEQHATAEPEAPPCSVEDLEPIDRTDETVAQWAERVAAEALADDL